MDNSTSGSGLLDHYQHFMRENSDPRTAEWFLVKGDFPLSLLLLLSSYLYFCKSVGPRLMEKRAAFQLKHIMMIYNACNVAVSVWLTLETLDCGWWRNYNFTCQPVDYSDNSKAIRMARAVWVYYMCKQVELLETIFFVMRKKNNQVSFLHLYHHIVMSLGSWIVVKFVAGGHGTFGVMLNSLVHAVMYSYYLLAGLGPQFQKYLWWKKYLTRLQLTQFVVVFLHLCQVFVVECDFPKIIALLQASNAVLLFAMFAFFYTRTYKKQSKTS